MTRQLAAFTLWPDASEVDASSRLRSALCRLRNSVGDVVDVANLDLQLRPDVVVDLRDAAGAGARFVRTARSRARGPDLGGCGRHALG